MVSDRYAAIRRFAKRTKEIFPAIVILTMFITAVYVTCGTNPSMAMGESSGTGESNIAYITGDNAWDTSANVSRHTYTESKCGVVIVVNANESNYPVALAASALTHHPRNGPVLFTPYESLADSTLSEITRLDSLMGSVPIKILAVGELSQNVTDRLAATGMAVEQIKGKNAYETAYMIDEMLGFPRTILIASAADGGTAACAAAWAAHAGTPILLVNGEEIPDATYRAINNTYEPEIYIIGNESAVPRSVDRRLRALNVKNVDRISGETPAGVSVNLAQFRNGLFGWGKMSDSANSFAIVRAGKWQDAISAALLAHLNWHMPV
ncbi:MAG: cell wall-binding repeat-containing protein, partial [Methanobacteriota archaeon]